MMIQPLRSFRRLGLWAGAVLSLGLAFGAAVTVLSAVDAVMLRPLPYPQQERLVNVMRAQGPQAIGPVMSGAAFRDIERQADVYAAVTAWTNTSFVATGSAHAERWVGAEVSSGFFDVMGLPPALGRALAAADEVAGAPDVLVLSHNQWRDQFKQDPAVLGRTLMLDGRAHTIVGVAHPEHTLPGRAVAVRPLRIGADGGNRGNNYLTVLARLAEGVSLAQAQAAMDRLAAQLAREYPDNHALLALRVQGLRDAMVAPARDAFTLMLAAIALLLLVGTASFVNLLLADHAARRSEFATRAALGCGLGRLIRGSVAETAALVALAAVVGLGIGAYAIEWLPQWLLRNRSLSLWPTAALALAMAAGIIALGCGLVVAAYTQRGLSARSLAGAARGASIDRAGQRTRKVLVVVQIALSLVLLIGAGLTTESMRRLLDVKPGFDTHELVAMRIALPADLVGSPSDGDDESAGGGPAGAFLLELERKLRAQPGFTAAAVVSRAPIIDGSGSNTGFSIAGEPQPAAGAEPLVELRYITPGYFETLGLPLVDGVGFTAATVAPEARRIIVNQALAQQYIHRREPVGAELLIGDFSIAIQGVVADARQDAPDQPVRPELYLSYLDWPGDAAATVVVRSDLPVAEVYERTRAVTATLRADVPVYDMRQFDEAAAGLTAQRRFLMTLMQFFGAAALAIALVGLYALFAHAVAQRALEFGIRQALGASPARVLRGVFGEGLRVSLAGIVLGLVGAVALGQVYTRLLYGVTATEPRVYATIALLLLVAALASVITPALRATRHSPLAALRSE